MFIYQAHSGCDGKSFCASKLCRLKCIDHQILFCLWNVQVGRFHRANPRLRLAPAAALCPPLGCSTHSPAARP